MITSYFRVKKKKSTCKKEHGTTSIDAACGDNDDGVASQTHTTTAMKTKRTSRSSLKDEDRSIGVTSADKDISNDEANVDEESCSRAVVSSSNDEASMKTSSSSSSSDDISPTVTSSHLKNPYKRAKTSTTSTNATTTTTTTTLMGTTAGTALGDCICPEVNELWNLLPPESYGWRTALEHQFRTTSFKALAKFVASERQNRTVYPPAPCTFQALHACPLSLVKVVIVGQDPYHGPNQAHGLCFSVQRGVAIPPSLKNMYKELVEDKRISNFTSIPSHGCLERWSRQGVLMLNTVLTVRKGEPNSHQKRGWEQVTDAIIKAVVDRDRTVNKNNDDDERTQTNSNSNNNNNKRGVVFLLWGKPATTKAQAILSSCTKHNKGRHTIITTSHPSPLGARKTDQPFLGSKCFSRCNDALIQMGYDPKTEIIDWNV